MEGVDMQFAELLYSEGMVDPRGATMDDQIADGMVNRAVR